MDRQTEGQGERETEEKNSEKMETETVRQLQRQFERVGEGEKLRDTWADREGMMEIH